MKTRWAVLIFVVVLFGSLSAFAGPTIIIGDPSCSSWNTSNGPIKDVTNLNSFSFSTNDIGGGYFGFCNKTGQQWTSVDFKFLSNSLPTIFCNSDVYQHCDITAITGGFDILFHDPVNPNSNSDPGGIPDGHFLAINMNSPSSTCTPSATNPCNGNGGDWPDDLTVYGGTNQSATIPTPEPATAILLTSGTAALWFRRRRK